MKMNTVVSSNIDSAGYDAASMTLYVKFKSGALYSYARVPVAEYQALLAAGSKGSYLNAHIKKQFEHTRVSGPFQDKFDDLVSAGAVVMRQLRWSELPRALAFV